MCVLVIAQTYTSVIRIFLNKLSVWRFQEIQYLLACQYPGRNWGFPCHGLLHAMPSKLGNTLTVFIILIIQQCQVA